MNVYQHQLSARSAAGKIYARHRKTSVQVKKFSRKTVIDRKRTAHGLVYPVSRHSDDARVCLSVRIGKRIEQICRMEIFRINVCVGRKRI